MSKRLGGYAKATMRIKGVTPQSLAKAKKDSK
jgi:hypothetical protein